MKKDLRTEQNIKVWDDIFASRNWGHYPPEELVRFMARTFPATRQRNSIRVLEVGCGPGANLWFLAREGFPVAGIDGSVHAIATAQQRLEKENPANDRPIPDLKIGNFADLPWPDDHFQCVLDIEAIYANTSQVIDRVISEVHRVLEPGGWFFGKMFGADTTGLDTGQEVEPGTRANVEKGPLRGTGLVHSFTEDEIRERFGAFGELRIDWVLRTDGNGAYRIFEWLVMARKEPN